MSVSVLVGDGRLSSFSPSRMERRRSHEGSGHSANERESDNEDEEEEEEGVGRRYGDEAAEESRSLISGSPAHTRASPTDFHDLHDPDGLRPPSHPSPSSSTCSRALRALLLVGLTVVVASYFALQSSSPMSLLSSLELPSLTPPSLFPLPGRGRTLVLYVHSENDGQHLPNFLYFLDKAVRCWQDVDYLFVINRDDAESLNATDPSAPWRQRLPPLPPNAKYILHPNECMDWGTAGWLLSLPDTHPDHVDTSKYRYFFLLNSSVKGPFLPIFLEERMDLDGSVQCGEGGQPIDGTSPASLFSWPHIFLSRLSTSVKLVGCTISCEIDTHVQSYLLAFDFVALQVLWQVDGRVKEGTFPIAVERDFGRWQTFKGGIRAVNKTGPAFTCPVDYASATRQGEVGASQAILSAGYNIAVMERFWYGVDFRIQPDLCTANRWVGNPSALGVPLDRMKGKTEHVGLVPWDVVFVKVKDRLKHPHDAIASAIVQWEDLAERTHTWQRNHSKNPSRRLVFPH